MDVSLIIHYMTYQTFLVNLSNQLFKSTYIINFLIESIALLTCDTALSLTNIRI